MAVARHNTILALDVGNKRIGVALASVIARLAAPYTTVINNDHAIVRLAKLIEDEAAICVVVGLPTNVNGADTEQTQLVRDFTKQLADQVKVPVYFQDEALTSKKAEAELGAKGRYNKEAVDALAATYILGDFIDEHPELRDYANS